jgi:hypothetical protein
MSDNVMDASWASNMQLLVEVLMGTYPLARRYSLLSSDLDSYVLTRDLLLKYGLSENTNSSWYLQGPNAATLH